MLRFNLFSGVVDRLFFVCFILICCSVSSLLFYLHEKLLVFFCLSLSSLCMVSGLSFVICDPASIKKDHIEGTGRTQVRDTKRDIYFIIE